MDVEFIIGKRAKEKAVKTTESKELLVATSGTIPNETSENMEKDPSL